MKIGFVGLGAMGLPMYSNLSRRFPDVVAFDVSRQTRDRARQAGLVVADSLDDIEGLDVIVTMLPNGQVVRDCLFGQTQSGGKPIVATLLSQHGVVIDMSSSSPLDSSVLARDLQSLGFEFADAPVSGSIPKARDATLSIMLGASDEIAQRIEPVLKSMGTTIIRTGAVGTAHAMKALNNYVYAAGLLAATEALLVGKSLGLDLEKLVAVFNSSSGRNVATETKLRQHMLEGGDFKGGFGLHLMAKDLGIGFGLRERAGFAPEQMALCHKLWQEAASEIAPGADNLEIYHFLESRYQHESDT